MSNSKNQGSPVQLKNMTRHPLTFIYGGTPVMVGPEGAQYVTGYEGQKEITFGCIDDEGRSVDTFDPHGKKIGTEPALSPTQTVSRHDFEALSKLRSFAHYLKSGGDNGAPALMRV